MKSVVMLSGGQDSTTALFWAKKYLSGEIVAISFRYGQRHIREVAVSSEICHIAEVEHIILDLPTLGSSVSALTNNMLSTNDMRCDGLPSTFVPLRNLVMLSHSAALAIDIGAETIVAGFNQVDYSGYPDCRTEFVDSFLKTLRLAHPGRIFNMMTPLINLNKSEIWEMAYMLGEQPYRIVKEMTITCYEGVESMNEWGKGCGVCPSCVIRRAGYYKFAENRRISCGRL